MRQNRLITNLPVNLIKTKDESIYNGIIIIIFKAYHKITEERKKYLTELDEVSIMLRTVGWTIYLLLLCSRLKIWVLINFYLVTAKLVFQTFCINNLRRKKILYCATYLMVQNHAGANCICYKRNYSTLSKKMFQHITAIKY